jgi:pyruvate formate lyase activating enzyme
VSELDIRAALEIGDFGFVHSFTTGSAVDGPGMRVVAWLGAVSFAASIATIPTPGK